MSTFDTPSPITAVVEIVAGLVRLVASDRADTVVEVSPRDPNRTSDVRIAEQARVDFNHGTLSVSAGRRFISLGRGGAVTVDIALPTGSRLHLSAASAAIIAKGDYGDCKLASASGDFDIDSVSGNLKADSASGDVTVRRMHGRVSISTASGDTDFGQLDGDAKFRGASGSLTVHRLLGGDVQAQTASGDVVVLHAVSGAVSAHTSSGDVQVGIAEGTSAQVDMRTRSGAVRNTLDSVAGPADGDEILLLRARTGSGDVAVRRATAADAMT